MRISIAAICLLGGLWMSGSAVAEDMPLPTLAGRVVDRAEILSEQTEAEITAKLDAHERQTSNQIVVVTLPDLMNRPIETWGLDLGRGWGIGQAEKNNGIVFLIAPKERELRIEVGYGLEGDLPDALAGQIIRNDIVPHFKAGNMEAGVSAGVDAILGVLDKTYQPSALVTADRTHQSWIADRILPFLFPGLWLIAVIAISVNRRKRKGRKGYEWYWQVNRGSGSGSFRSGGGFSGGGGSFGGGGASGKW